jgi:hypothetical protein
MVLHHLPHLFAVISQPSSLRSTEEPPIPLKPNASCQFLHKTLTLKKGFTPTTQHTVHMTTRSTRCCPTLTHQKKQQHPQQFEQQQQEYMIRTGEVRTIWRTGVTTFGRILAPTVHRLDSSRTKPNPDASSPCHSASSLGVWSANLK